MSGCVAGAERTAAKRIGVDLATYRQQRAAGLRWCSTCRAWMGAEAFTVDRRRPNAVRCMCKACDAARKRLARRR